jgi:diguanylate cyclase (GGDEF)-like protein
LAISTYLADVWSATDFGDPELSGYAETQMRKDTRIGVQTMALLSLLLQLVILALLVTQEIGSAYLYTNIILGILSLHILVSASFLDDIRTLHALGMSFLVIGAVAVTFLAHRAGDLNIGMIASIIMLLIAIPLVPWALREAVIVVGLTYVLLTASLVSVPGRFAPGSLWILQTLLVGTALVVVVISGRNTFIRKQDIRARFELEQARRSMELLSMQDHLTGAWNRRFLDDSFPEFAKNCAEQNAALHVAILDIDDFKRLNDCFGHQVGDRILIKVAHTFSHLLGDNGRLIRLGGDEFLIVYRGNGLDAIIDEAIGSLQHSTIASKISNSHAIMVSAGIASTEPGHIGDLDSLYKRADRALYAAKQDHPCDDESELVRTGSWKL